MFVHLLATLDTKGHEAEFVRRLLVDLDVEVRVVDVGCLGEPVGAVPDVTRRDIFAAAEADIHAVIARRDRGEAVGLAALGAKRIVETAYAEGRLAGVLALGGSAGSTIGTEAMRALPIGVPKLMVSTLASGQVRHFVGDKDILMLNSVVDILGVNRISELVLTEAAHAMAGMVNYRTTRPPDGPAAETRPLVAATMFGVTTPCVEEARRLLEAKGFEVLVFHATGTGGQTMESLIREGLIAGVLDITTTELADELFGGVLSAGPSRLTAAAERGIPQVVSVGATDMVNFHGIATVPEQYAHRLLHRHNASVTLMRTTAEENDRLGRHIGAKLMQASGPTALLLPLRGVSAIDASGQPFEDEAARSALFAGLRATCRAPVEVIEVDRHINDPEFAAAAVEKLVALLGKTTPS